MAGRFRFDALWFRNPKHRAGGVNADAIRVVLFDVGGVLVQASGVDALLNWMKNRISAEELWRIWLSSPTVRAFETGTLSAEEFAARVIAELRLPILGDELLRNMTYWSVTPFSGAEELVERIPTRHLRATLCNSNSIQWPGLMRNNRLAAAFSHHFASHLTGKIKPDVEAFRHVTDVLCCDPKSVLFLDDNQLNVVGARAVGMHAMRVRGIEEAERALLDCGVISD